jgi:hypothetical protein
MEWRSPSSPYHINYISKETKSDVHILRRQRDHSQMICSTMSGGEKQYYLEVLSPLVRRIRPVGLEDTEAFKGTVMQTLLILCVDEIRK